MLVDELPLLEIRRHCRLLSLCTDVSEGNLIDDYSMTIIQMAGSPAGQEISVLPRKAGDGLPQKWLRVDDWLEQTVFLEGQGSLANRQKGLPVAQAKKQKRISVSRRQLLSVARNETGAHFDRSITYEYLQMHHFNTPISFGFIDENGDEVDQISNPTAFAQSGEYGSASILTIANEVIESFRSETNQSGKTTIHYNRAV